MLIYLSYAIAGLVLLTLGAQGLIRGSSALALGLGITPLVVGLTVVSLATGSPELAVSLKGAFSGDSGVSLGNILGSNISNLTLVLGVAALARPMKVPTRLVRREMPIMVGATALLWGLLLDGDLSRLEGILLLGLAIAYLAVAYLGARSNKDAPVSRACDEALGKQWSSKKAAVITLVGLVVLIAGAELLVSGAVSVAQTLGVSNAVIALTVIAIGTSTPELAASVVAARGGNADVAFGNIIGSNTINILAVLGVTATISPFVVEGIRTTDIAVFAGSSVLVLVLMAQGWVLNRLEGLLLLVLYAMYMYFLLA